MYVITAHQRHRQTDRRTSSDPMTATLLKHVAVKREMPGTRWCEEKTCLNFLHALLSVLNK